MAEKKWYDYIPIVGDVISLFAGLTGISEAEANMKYQQENLAYQKQLQQTIFKREDTAVQRRAEDLAKAGLSKTLAAGSSAGAGTVVGTSAPQSDTFSRIVQAIALQKERAETEKITAEAVNERARSEMIIEQIQKTKAETAYTVARTALAGGQTEYLGVQSDQVRQLIEKAKVEVEHEMLKMKYTQAQIDEAASRKNYVEAQTEVQKTYDKLLLEKVTGQIYANDMQYLDNLYVYRYGNKMPSPTTWGKMFDQGWSLLAKDNVKGTYEGV